MHPSVINDMYVQNDNIYDYNTRQKFQLHISKGQTDLYAKGFYCSSILYGMKKQNVQISSTLFSIQNITKTVFAGS